MTRRLIALVPELNADSSVRSVVLWGGENRAFSVGGDFHDISALTNDHERRDYLLEIIDLYVALLRIDKPVVAAIDQFAIGQGLQVALCADWKVATHRTTVSMPELANGVACPLGALLLESLLGRARMMHAVIGCPSFTGEQARAFDLVDQLVEPDQLWATAHAQATRLASFHSVPYSTTKRIHNGRLIAALDAIRGPAADAHAASFAARANAAHFEKIIGAPSRPTRARNGNNSNRCSDA